MCCGFAGEGLDQQCVLPLMPPPFQTSQRQVVSHPLALDERMVALACAISIDYNYFSRLSHSSESSSHLAYFIILL